jgi:hypothetical protein
VVKLEKAVGVVAVVAAIAYSLGWLKTFSYFETFGIGLPTLNMSIQDYLFESWFVLENVVFFVLFSWVLQAGFRLGLPNRAWRVLWCFFLSALAILYLMLPYLTDWASGLPEAKLAVLNCNLANLFSHYYTLLKLSPFLLYALVVLGAVAVVLVPTGHWNKKTLTAVITLSVLILFVGWLGCFLHWNWKTVVVIYVLLGGAVGVLVWTRHWEWKVLCKDMTTELEQLFPIPKWPMHHLHLIYIVVLLAWSVSLAKHVGAIDGKNRLRDPRQYFSQVTLHPSPGCLADLKKRLEDTQDLYILHESPKNYFAWDHTGFDFRKEGQKAQVLVIPRESVGWVESSKEVQTKPAGTILF